MRAIVVEQPCGPDALFLVDVPEPVPGADEVLVEVEAVGVNPVDLGNRSDPAWAEIAPPYVVVMSWRVVSRTTTSPCGRCCRCRVRRREPSPSESPYDATWWPHARPSCIRSLRQR